MKLKLSDLPPEMQAQLSMSPTASKRHARFKRRKPGQMNETEEAWSLELERRRHNGEILAWWFEGLRFRLADNTGITPDFFVLVIDKATGEPMAEIHEVKALWKKGNSSQDDAWAKIKIAADQYWPFSFVVMFGRKQSKKDGGGWIWQEKRLS